MFDCVQHGLRPVCHLNLAEYIRQMVFYRLFTEKKFAGNLGIAHPSANQLHDLNFAA